jgi:transcriptional regulator with XRE-family HTH domain
MSNISRLITEKELRDGKRYKQRDIVRATQLSPSMVSRIIRGDIDYDNVTWGVLRRFAKWLGCSTDEMFTIVDVPDQPEN